MESFFIDKPVDLIKPKLSFLSYSTRSERYNALVRLIVIFAIIVAVSCVLMNKPTSITYTIFTVSIILIFILCLSYYFFKTTTETYVPFTVSPGYSWRNNVAPVYDARGADSQDYGGFAPESTNSRRIVNPDLYVGIEKGDKEGRPIGIPDSDKTDLIYPTFPTRKGMQKTNINPKTKEGFTFRSNTYDPPLGFGAVGDLKEEESIADEPVPEPKVKVIKEYPNGGEEKRPLKYGDTTDLFPEVAAFKAGENPPSATEIPDLVPDRIYRGQVVQPAGRPGYTTSEIPINDRMGNVDGGYPPQDTMMIQDGNTNAMLFTFERNGDDGRPISGVYEGVNVGGTVYSPSTALGGDPSRTGFWIEPGIVQYNYRNVPNDMWIGKPNFVLRSKIDMYDYQNPISQQYPEMIKNPGYNDIKDQVIDQTTGDELLFRESMMNGYYIRRNMTDPLVRSAPIVRGARYGGISSQ